MVLGLLSRDQDSRSECASLKRLLTDDWEFRFTVNYYLRDTVYTDEVYKEFLRRVEEFPATVTG